MVNSRIRNRQIATLARRAPSPIAGAASKPENGGMTALPIIRCQKYAGGTCLWYGPHHV